MKLTIEPRGEVFRMAGGELVQVWNGRTSEGRDVTVLVAGVSGLYGAKGGKAAPAPAGAPDNTPPVLPGRLGVRRAAALFGLSEFEVVRLCERHPQVATRVSGPYRNGRQVYAIDAAEMAPLVEAKRQNEARKRAGLGYEAAALRLGISGHSVRRYCEDHPHVVDRIVSVSGVAGARHAVAVDVDALAAVIAAKPRMKWARRPPKEQPTIVGPRAAAERLGITEHAVRRYCKTFPLVARRVEYGPGPAGWAFDIDMDALAAVVAAHPRRRYSRGSAHASPHQAPATSGPGASPGSTTDAPAAPQPSHRNSDSRGAGKLSTA